MAGDFDKLWDCPKKHTKRTKHWLPRAKAIKNGIGDERAFRYLTFCARPMIDVFMLVREGILGQDVDLGTINEVVFCEKEAEDHSEITTILGDPGSGFARKLEDLVLFRNNHATLPYEQIADIDLFFQTQREDRRPGLRERLTEKKEHLQLLEKFPFDFINLDFCGYYYPPPDILEINKTVRKILELQNQQGQDDYGKTVSVDRFLLSVTCRFDEDIPSQAWTRLEKIVQDNLKSYEDYCAALNGGDKSTNLKDWRKRNSFDFFLSAWPKEILAFSRECSWKMEIKDTVYYIRGRGRDQYRIVCLVAEFERSENVDVYLEQAIHALDSDLRTFIGKINPKAPDSLKLLADLKSLVQMRNERAKKMGVKELPQPVFH